MLFQVTIRYIISQFMCHCKSDKIIYIVPPINYSILVTAVKIDALEDKIDIEKSYKGHFYNPIARDNTNVSHVTIPKDINKPCSTMSLALFAMFFYIFQPPYFYNWRSIFIDF